MVPSTVLQGGESSQEGDGLFLRFSFPHLPQEGTRTRDGDVLAKTWKAIGQDPVDPQRESANELTAAHVVACGTPLTLYPNTVSTSMRRREPQAERRTTVRPPEQVALKACEGTYGQRRLLRVLESDSPLARSTSRSALQEKESQVTVGTQRSPAFACSAALQARGARTARGEKTRTSRGAWLLSPLDTRSCDIKAGHTSCAGTAIWKSKTRWNANHERSDLSGDRWMFEVISKRQASYNRHSIRTGYTRLVVLLRIDQSTAETHCSSSASLAVACVRFARSKRIVREKLPDAPSEDQFLRCIGGR